MAPGALELELPDGLDEAGALALLATRLRVQAARPRTADRVLLDTFDARLRAAGLRAEWPACRATVRKLALHEAGVAVRRADVADAPVALRALPPGPLRERLAPVLEERALLPLARVRSRTVSVAVLNDDDKTVARLVLERPTLVRGRATQALSPRLRAEPLRGYDREFERAVRALDLPPAQRSLHDAAVLAAGGRPEGVSSKVRVALEPDMRADVAAGMVLGRLAEIAEANLPGTLDDLDPEFLHDLRVSIRRARSVLRELKHVHHPERRARLREELKWAQAVTGPVRDLDVQLMEWDALTRPLAQATELQPLRRMLERRREKELARQRRALRSRRFAAALDAWKALAAEPGDQPGGGLPIRAVAAGRIRSVYRRMVRDGRAIDDDSPDAALHELRKRGKELRYLLELFGGLFPSDVVKPMVTALKDLQDVLGRFQDRSVQMELLRASTQALAAEPGGPDALLSVGVVLAALQADQRDARAHFAERFAAFAAPEQRALVRDTFPKAERV